MADGLRARDLSVTRGRSRVLHEVSVDASYGEVTAVLGPNGAGKSTLLKALVGLLPFVGSVHLDGTDLHALPALERAKRVAFVPQTTLLRSALPVRSVVSQGRYPHLRGLGVLSKADARVVDEALRVADVENFADRAFTSLSFGEQRRVLLARGLATEARVLCLDEPTASLDVRHALSLYALLRELAGEGRAIVVVLHQLDDALRFTDRAALLSAGRLVASGIVREVVAADNVRSVYGVEMRSGPGLTFELP